MAISVKTVGRSVLESMLFLAFLSMGITILSKIEPEGSQSDSWYWITIPVLCTVASLLVALVFPKPTYWRAFFKFLLGAFLTMAIFGIILAIVGPILFSWILELLWGTGGYIWDWASGNGVAAGVGAVMMYIFFTIFVFGLVLSGLFALTNMLVVIGVNMFIERRNQGQAQ
ncbi:MAG: hypothetical protein IPN95_21345 [Bacteroidetes bacterium]|nr:hypothetical protein [Bacteroidota bacterium]